jgi:hypothetical protein
MGSVTAMEIANNVDSNGLSLYTAMMYHLHNNHYPPVPLSMIEPCLKAIEAGNDWDWNREIELPEEVLYKGQFKTAPASSIIEAHHLEWFLEQEEYD